MTRVESEFKLIIMPIYEMRCAAHGPYESTEKKCPHGCPARFQVQEIRTPPAYHDGRTRHTDETLRGLADSCGLTDMKNDKDGSSVMSHQTRPKDPNGLDFSPKWIDVPHANPGWSRREGEKSPVVYPDSLGMANGGSIVEQFKTQGLDKMMVGPTIQASKEKNLFVGHAKAEDLQ